MFRMSTTDGLILCALDGPMHIQSIVLIRMIFIGARKSVRIRTSARLPVVRAVYI